MALQRWRSAGRALAIGLAGVVVITACGGGDDDTAADQFEDALEDLEDGAPAEDGFGEQREPKEPELTPVELDLPRETTYGNATWTVDEVVYRGVGVDEYGVETAPAAVVAFTVANTGEQAGDLTMMADRLWLVDGGGFEIRSDYGTGGDGEVLPANGGSSFEAVFPLDTGIDAEALAEYSLKIGLEGDEPALIPLSGEVPAPDYPLALTPMPASVDGLIIGNGDTVDTGSATLRNVTAEVILDWGPDRTDEGTRILVIDAEVLINNGTQAYLSDDDLRVSIDGVMTERLEAETPDATADLREGSVAAGTWVFVIPSEGKEGVLHFGSKSEPGAKGGAFTLPALP